MQNVILDKLAPKIKALKELSDKRDYVGNTVELVGAFLKFKRLTEDDFASLSPKYFSLSDAFEIVSAILRGDTNRTIGVYDLSYYRAFTVDILRTARRIQAMDSKELDSTRQLSIAFDAAHCFQFVQFMRRGSRGYINIGMRSCNLKANFLTDLYLCWFVGNMLLDTERIDVNIFIGSLHLFKTDAADYFENTKDLIKC